MQRLVIDVDDKYTTIVIELLSNLKENVNLSNLEKFRELRAKYNNKITLTKKLAIDTDEMINNDIL